MTRISLDWLTTRCSSPDQRLDAATGFKTTALYHADAEARLYDCHPEVEDVRQELLAGLLGQGQKSIPPKYLYDARGAALFDQICRLDEYYVTRAEAEILRDHGRELAALVGQGALVEFGSGSCDKSRLLLDASTWMDQPSIRVYVGLDISQQQLFKTCQALAMDYPPVQVIGLCVDYTQPLDFPVQEGLHRMRKVGFFPGSSIGNLEPEEAIAFLRQAAQLLGPDGGLLVGVDLKKSRGILERAYDDSQGVSAAFALNGLVRMNRELGAEFELSQFRYGAEYDEELGRVVMFLESCCEQAVSLGESSGEAVGLRLAAGERIVTEYSYNYGVEEFQDLARQAGFVPEKLWCDGQGRFAMHYLKLAGKTRTGK